MAEPMEPMEPMEPTGPTLESLAKGKYLSLTTYRRDGTAVATPVWLVRDGDALRVITQASSGKVKRIRNNSSVLIASCDSRGRLSSGQVPAVATLQDSAETMRTSAMITRRYGLLGRLLMWRSARAARRTGEPTAAGISITMPT